MTFGSLTRHILCCTLLAATPLIGTACSGGSGSSRSAATKSDLGVDVTYDNWHKIGYDLSWIGYPFGKLDRRQRVVQFQAYDDIVIAQSSDSTVTILETSTGKRRWGSEISSPLTRYMGLAKDPSDSNRINVCSESELFVLAISNGALLSRQQFERVVSTAPLMVGETVVFGTNTNELYAHGTRLGNRAWGMITDGGYDGAPILVGDTIATVAQSGAVQFLTSRGKLLGDRRIYGGVETEPVTNGSKLIIASLDQSLWGFDPFSAAVWRYRASAPLRVQPSVHGDFAWCEIPGEGLVCFDAASGAVIWKSKDAAGTVFANRRGKLLAWNAGEILQLDASNGDVISRFKTPGIIRVSAPSFNDGPIYAVSDLGAVAKFITK